MSTLSITPGFVRAWIVNAVAHGRDPHAVASRDFRLMCR
jgi:hypothetical protein